MELHGVGVGVRQDQRRAGSACGTDSAEQIGVFVALVGRLAWSRSAPGPLPDAAILLADAGLVLKTKFRPAPSAAGHRDERLSASGKFFSKRLDRPAFWAG